MKFFLLTSLLSVLLMALETANPKVYAALGDEVYVNAVHIKKLKALKHYASYADKIDNYIANVKKTKKLGYDVESGNHSNIKLDYLHQLRKHKNVNDYFLRSAQSTLKLALDTKDTSLFINIVNSKLIDTKLNRKIIMNYYKVHKKDINPDGIIQIYLDEDKDKAEARRNKNRWKQKAKKNLQEEKIARLRKNDKLDEEALDKKLSDELKAKKTKIRQEQEKELFN
ncbi:MAG: hypothetical protein ACI9TV_000024 [Sulfurimonas sp.]|jgi:hypothetical protein|uniref:hypothetical protein n=1 Tax=Sulfurimonas sp. TaxID=2022749 RepID=UPI0039E3C6CE